MASTKFIKIPSNITPIEGGPEFSFVDMVTYVIDNEPRFQSPVSNTRAGIRLLVALDDAKESVAEIKEEDHKLLHEVLDKPANGYASWRTYDQITKQFKTIEVPTRKYITFIDAVDEATNSDPRTKKNVAEVQVS